MLKIYFYIQKIFLRHYWREIYKHLQTTENYSAGSHGLPILFDIYYKFPDVKNWLDIGCGNNDLIKQATANGLNIPAHGCDLTHPNANFNCPAHKTGLKNNSYDIVTSFDMLEHIIKPDIIPTLQELNRISKKYVILRICMQPAFHQVKGNIIDLHPAALNPQTWEYLLKTHIPGKLTILKKNLGNEIWNYYVIKK
jgi:hypothetical protein